MNAYGAYRRAADILRAALLAASLAGAGLLLLWHESPSTVESIDEWLRLRHLRPHQARLEEAAAAIERGEHSRAIDLLEPSRRALRSVQKGDRLDPLKRKTLEKLVQSYDATSQPEQTLAALDEWIAFDSRDLRPVAQRAKHQGAEGFDTLLDLKARFPQAKFLANPLPEMLWAADRKADAFILLAEGLVVPPQRSWQIYWDVGEGFRNADSERIAAAVDDTGETFFGYTVPGPARRLRIDAPNSAHLFAGDLRVRLDGPGTSVTIAPVTIALSNAKPRNQIRNLDPSTLVLSGPDPHLHVKVPEALRTVEHLRVQVRGRVYTAPSSTLAEHLISPDAPAIFAELVRRGAAKQVDHLRQMRRWLLADSALETE